MVAVFQIEDRAISRAKQLNDLAEVKAIDIKGRILGQKAKFLDIQEYGLVDLMIYEEGKKEYLVSIPFNYLEMEDDQFNQFYTENMGKI